MPDINNVKGKRTESSWTPSRCLAVIWFVLMPLSILANRAAFAQVAEPANSGGVSVSVGGGITGSWLQYGQRKEFGFMSFLDTDSKSRLGIETEARWLEFNKTADTHVDTYLAGIRYHFNANRWQPYLKLLTGVGEFTFPYDYAHGRYFVSAAGVGTDYRLTRRWGLRLDGEYQRWPQFTFGSISSTSIVVGARYYIFDK